MPYPNVLLIVSLIGLLLAGVAAAFMQFARRPPHTAKPTMWAGLFIGLAGLSAFAAAYQVDDGGRPLVPPKCKIPIKEVCRLLNSS